MIYVQNIIKILYVNFKADFVYFSLSKLSLALK